MTGSATATDSSPFFRSRADRITLARQRYFEEGQPPSGVVSEAVFSSWARCQRLHSSPGGKVSFQPVTLSRTNLALQKSRALGEAWEHELPNLQALLGRTSTAAMLTDATGVLIGATCVGRSHEHLMPIATRTGVDLSEEAVGTTAPGVVARTEQPVCVFGAEHFFDDVKGMHCAAAPIRDTRGQLVGVLDLSSEVIPFNFDAGAVVGVYAAAIENRLLMAQSGQLVIRFQIEPSLLESPFAALAGIDGEGRFAWMNATASRLLGTTSRRGPDNSPPPVEASLSASISELASLPATGSSILRLSNGLMVWARAEMRAPDGRRGFFPGFGPGIAAIARHEPIQTTPFGDASEAAEDVNAPEIQDLFSDLPRGASHLASLRDSGRALIQSTLDSCGGNVSVAAVKLGVSRGLIYRRLRSGVDH